MLKSLRWQIVGAISLVILLTILISGVLSSLITTNRFDLLVTDQGRERAEGLAPLLEASYRYWGDWRHLDQLLNPNQFAIVSDFPADVWFSSVNWDFIIEEMTGVSVFELDERTMFLGSSEAAYAEVGTTSDELIAALVIAEAEAIAQAEERGEISDEIAELSLELVTQEIEAYIRYVPEGVNWDEVIANELGLPMDRYFRALETQSIEELALAQGVNPDKVIDTVVEAEIEFLKESPISPFEIDAVYFLADIKFAIEDFVYNKGFPMGEPVDATGLLFASLFANERILVVDIPGRVVFDSEDILMDESLPKELQEQGLLLYDGKKEPIGTVIITSSEGAYSAQEAAFLDSVTLALIVAGLVAGGVGLTVGLFVANRITKPVVALTQAASQLAEGKEQVQVAVSGNGELAQMSSAFNQMSHTIQTQRALRNQLINDVSHELNTPLSVIQLEMEALRDGMQSPDEAIGHVQREVDLLRNLTQDLSLLTQSDWGALQLVKKSINLGSFMERAVARWQSKADVEGITLRWIPNENSPEIVADETRLSQVLGNLIDNALRHTPRGGEVRVWCEANGSFVQTYVKDTGSGIRLEDLPFVFERFYRADQSRKRSEGGRGLGLAIVEQIVTLHGGEVKVESEPGRGSQFSFSLPIKPA